MKVYPVFDYIEQKDKLVAIFLDENDAAVYVFGVEDLEYDVVEVDDDELNSYFGVIN